MATGLNGQTVVVLGGSSGIGRAVASLAAEHGARVYALSRTGRAPAGVEGLPVPVEDYVGLTAAFAVAGRIDHLVHTVGARLGSPPLGQLGDDVLPELFATKLFSAIHALRLSLPYLAAEASITLTSGQVSRKYGTGSFAKGAVNAATDAAGRHLAKELAPRRVNVVSPGVVDTDLWGDESSERRLGVLAKASETLPVGRAGTPADLASAYLFLMTNSFVTAGVLDVDGGALI